MPEGIALLTIFVLSAFTGYEVISKVSTVLHTPLMSSANAISGLILVGAVLVAGRAETTVELVVGLIAVCLSAVNLVGGFVVTDRMLEMFRTRGRPGEGPVGRRGRKGRLRDRDRFDRGGASARAGSAGTAGPGQAGNGAA